MCTVSDKIILCTCEIKDISSLRNYWILFRHDPKQGEFIVGQPINFEGYTQKHNLNNPATLCNKLNSENLFDKPLEFFDKDRLQISIHFKGNEYPTDYGFEYQNRKWRVIEFEYFSWRADHIEFREGKIKNAAVRETAKNNTQ